MKFLKKAFILLFLFLVLATALILGFLGFLPGLTEFLGADRAVSLGVEYEALDAALAQEKTGVSVGELSATDFLLTSLQYSGSHSVEAVFNERELTALANAGSWQHYPLENVQIRLNPDNSVEISGLLKSERLVDYLELTGESPGMTAQVLKVINLSQRKIPFYLLVQVAVLDDQVDLNLKKVSLGRLAIPRSFLEKNETSFESFIQNKMFFVKGLSIKSLTVKDGEVSFVGTLPNEELIGR